MAGIGLHQWERGGDMRVRRFTFAAAALLVLCGSTLVGTSSASATTAEPTVRSKLLTLSNLPSGWTLSNVPASTKGIGGPCAGALTAKPEPGITEAHIFFDDRGRLPLLAEAVASGKGVPTRYRYINAVLKSCKSVTLSSGGTRQNGTVRPLAFRRVGSASSAYRVNLPTTLGANLGIDLVVVRSGPYALEVEYSAMGTPDSSVLRNFVKQALAKVTGVGSTAPSPDEVPPTTTPAFQ